MLLSQVLSILLNIIEFVKTTLTPGFRRIQKHGKINDADFCRDANLLTTSVYNLWKEVIQRQLANKVYVKIWHGLLEIQNDAYFPNIHA